MYKKIMTAIACVLFLSVCATPNESADWQVYVLWGIWTVSAVFIANLIFRHLEEEK